MSEYGTTLHGRAADGYLQRVRNGLTKRQLWLIVTGVLAGIAALRRRPWLAGAAALAGVVASRVLKPSADHRPERPRATSEADDATRPMAPDVTVTSMGFPAPPTVTVGPAATPST